MPKFSVVIPLYNKEKDIAHTLTSVLNQTFTDFEIIIIDDGSTDTSAKIIEDFKSDKVVLYSKKNEGVSIARNFGLKKSNSDFIVFLDADDYWFPNHLENINALVEKFPNGKWFATAYEKKHTHKLVTTMNSPILNKGNNWVGEVDDFFKNSLIDVLTNSSNVAFKKEFYISLGGFNNQYTHGEDTDLWIRAALKEKLVFSNIITAQQNLMSSNRSSKVSMKNRNNFLFDKFLKEEKNNSSLKKYLDLNRFSLAVKHKLANNQESFKEHLQSIDLNNLNTKQRFLLKQPRVFLKLLIKIKSIFENSGFRLSSFK